MKEDDFKKQKELRKKAAEPKSPYEALKYNVSDPLVPVQGHGLTCLTCLNRLLAEQVAETLNNLDKVRLIFLANLLEDSDTYLNGLVAAARGSPSTSQLPFGGHGFQPPGAVVGPVEAGRGLLPAPLLPGRHHSLGAAPPGLQRQGPGDRCQGRGRPPPDQGPRQALLL